MKYSSSFNKQPIAKDSLSLNLKALALSTILFVAGCGDIETNKLAIFEKITIGQLPNIQNDDMKGALQATKKSCSVFLRQADNKMVGTTTLPLRAKHMKGVCKLLLPIKTVRSYKRWLKSGFDAWQVSSTSGNTTGTFTGYFEAELHGYLKQTSTYKYPIYGFPHDMAIADLSKWGNNKLTGKIVGRMVDKKFVPYMKRRDIDAKKINAPILAWAKDPVEVFLLHIQGSGRIKLPEGGVLRLGYAGNNGHKYKSLGKALIDSGHMTYSNANWGNIKRWVKNNPDKADDMLATNERYIFFRNIKSNMGGPIGKMGVALTPRRSIAVDHGIIPMGLPLWLDAGGVGDIDRISRLMQTQDTGSAIRGAVRGDFFWGYGVEALSFAGKMKSKGTYYIFLPKGINPNTLR